MLFPEDKHLIIAGPCSLENDSVCQAVAEKIKAMQAKHPECVFIFKGSFDKANRTSINSLRGPGLEKGLQLLSDVKVKYQLPITTDVHESHQVAAVGEVCDAIQIPAFLCRQTDLLVAAAKTGKAVNVKKGQFLAPSDMQHVVTKLKEAEAAEFWLTDRGTSFGYHNLVVDMRSFNVMKTFGAPVIFDATHSTQLPGAAGGKSGGQREYVLPLARAACAAGAQGLFIETHPSPADAISDAATQVPFDEFEFIIESCLKVWNAVK